MKDLELQLIKAKDARSKIIVTDGVFQWMERLLN